ncbi:hypothetical protein ZWY2020_014915 [Hordeum vulgare]|nr:hypothetical protein ZWY2020_014915 [Hordeum vulgare]
MYPAMNHQFGALGSFCSQTVPTEIVPEADELEEEESDEEDEFEQDDSHSVSPSSSQDVETNMPMDSGSHADKAIPDDFNSPDVEDTEEHATRAQPNPAPWPQRYLGYDEHATGFELDTRIFIPKVRGGRVLNLGVPLELHASKVYTAAMYELFQHAIYLSGSFVLQESWLSEQGMVYVVNHIYAERRQA